MSLEPRPAVLVAMEWWEEVEAALSKENVGNNPYCPCPKTVSVFRYGLLDINIKIFSIPEMNYLQKNRCTKQR